ncbi:MAG: 50S ribosomal protein L4 [Candidatus Pacearchaeota archaeon]
MTKINILTIGGKKAKEISLPNFFSAKIREDLISKIIEAKRVQQPYGPSPSAGKSHSASGKIRHRRHVWKTHYGKGIARIPRKIMTRRGSQFNWTGATVPQAVGGRRAHPPKPISMINNNKINKKEMKIAFISALSATSSLEEMKKRYDKLRTADLKGKELPLIVDFKVVELKTKDLLDNFKKILGDELFKVALIKKSVRSGKGKLRGRKYKSNAGLLFVIGKDEKVKTSMVDVKSSKNVSVMDLAKGKVGRLTVYTEEALKDLEEKLK